MENSQFDLKGYLNKNRDLVEAALERYLPFKEGIYKDILEAMRYSLFAGGKRLRPILCLAATEAVGGSKEIALPVACALEMIHTYSLIHDDLPAMDNDDLRRGKPTNHKVFGEAMAILAGDGLLTEAFALLSHPDLTQNIPAERVVQVINLIAQAAGYKGMVGGQVMDLNYTGKEIDLKSLETMHRHKTGALIVASVKSGAIVGGGKAEEIDALGEYAVQIGLAFQIVDDILDVEGDVAEMGKRPGSDAEQNKATYPRLLGLSQAKERAKECIKKAIKALEPFERKALPLKAIAEYIGKRRK